MSEWKECRLGDFSSINQKQYSSSENWTYVNYLDTGNIKNNEIDSVQVIDLTNDKLPSRAKRKVKENSILYSTVRPNQRHFGFIKKPPKNFLVSTGFAVIDTDEAIANSKYIYYYLIQDTVISHLHSIAEQSVCTYPSIKPSDIADLLIPLPPLDTQRKIASILSALDDKIELNRRMNKNLEEQARAIYKSWFVDFEPWGGVMPDGWRMGKLNELINIKYGKDHKKLSDGIYPAYGSGGIMRYVDKPIYEKESVLIPRKGTLKNVYYIDQPFWTVDTIFYTEIKLCNLTKYIYFFMRSVDLCALDTGSAVPSMTTELLNAMSIMIPTPSCLQQFEAIVSPLFVKIKNCTKESRNLATLRDTLLPKLMRGEIDVENVVI